VDRVSRLRAEELSGAMMKRCLARRCAILAFMLGVATGLAAVASAHATPAASTPTQVAEQKAACTKNLKAIYDAIQAFQADHHELPNL
jgi:hypothetical protein